MIVLYVFHYESFLTENMKILLMNKVNMGVGRIHEEFLLKRGEGGLKTRI